MFLALDSSFPYGDEFTKWVTDNTNQLSKQIVQSSMFDKLLQSVWIKTYALQEGSAAYYIKTIVDYFLGILAVLALFVLIYGFYLLLFSDKNFSDNYNKAKKYIFWASVAIIIIWISWLLVSWLIYIVGKGV